MSNTFITHLQIFGIGFSFGIIGPCFLVCTPILITYIAGREKRWRGVFGDLFTFLSGRLVSYVILGFLAGLSSALVARFTSSNLALIFKPLGGLISILLGILVLVNKENVHDACKTSHGKVYNFGGLFTLGFIIGVTPCAPLVALLLEIALISKTALEGASYALSFGLGTFFSGLVVVGILAGILTGVAAKVLRSRTSNLIFRIACASLLILLGLGLIVGRYSYITALSK